MTAPEREAAMAVIADFESEVEFDEVAGELLLLSVELSAEDIVFVDLGSSKLRLFRYSLAPNQF